MLLKITLLAISISLCACSTVGNVVPTKGKDMEQVYDGMGKQKENCHALYLISYQPEINKIRIHEKEKKDTKRRDCNENNRFENSRNEYNDDACNQSIPVSYTNHEFKKLRNPALVLYVYPHFAGSDEVPIPGYHTVFNAFERDHYVLASEFDR
jgi:conjugative transfer region lipoprotein (TIGR03751 family)